LGERASAKPASALFYLKFLDRRPLLRDVMPANPVDTFEFRKLMSLFATGVCVVSVDTGDTGDTGVSGITVNSFVSVSLNPVLVCWNIQNSSSQFDLYTKAADFTVSILAEEHETQAQRYAARGNSQFVASDFGRTTRGLPIIAGAPGYLECRLWSLYPAGDSTMIFGEVTAMSAPRSGDDLAMPLGFFGGRFCRINR
jgi:flavin reductase (DIM6/NTAB) family NADH-FMN oxidoreductase RutF